MAPDVLSDMRYIGREKFDESKATLLLNELYPGKNLEVPDPWYGPEAGYHEVYELIERACEKIIEKYAADSTVQQNNF